MILLYMKARIYVKDVSSCVYNGKALQHLISLNLSLSFYIYIYHIYIGRYVSTYLSICTQRQGLINNTYMPTYSPDGTVVKESACQYRRCKRSKFDPWVQKILWRRKWQTTPVFLPRKSHGQRNLVGYSLWGRNKMDMTEHKHKLYIYIYVYW